MLRSLVAALMSFSLVVGASLAHPAGPAWAESQKPEDKSPEPPKPDDKKPDTPKPDDKKPEDKKPDDKKPDTPKPDDKKPDDKKPDDKKPEDKKPDDKKPDDKKPEDKKPDTPKAEEKKASEPERRPATKTAKKESKIKPFDEIITSEAKSDSGLFTVHRLDDKIFYEIPTEALGKDILWVTQIEKTGAGNGYGGSPVGDRVVRWEIRNDDVLLRDVNYDIRADTKDPIHNAVESSSVEPIIAVLPVKAYGKDKAPVVDVTELFTSDIPEINVGRRLGGAGADPRKTFIEGVKSFPENIETKILMTFRRGGGLTGAGPGGPQPNRGAQPGSGGSSVTALVHHSMIKLPDEPMKPRKFDDRVGFFTEAFQDYGDITNHQVEDVRYITRWRLEKKDPSAELSEPKKPIVFYVGREVPDKFRPAIKKGIEAWQVAFEKAGFKNAILAKDAPKDDDWDAEDARYSTIRWLPATIENAMGPHVHDPRSGEILEADILVYHNILKLTRDWYFIQASPNDPKAQALPLSDDLISDLLTYVVAHEVGHSLGFPHNMKASSSFTVAQLRDPKFTAENGTEASIMDYGRFNYVAQPGDGARLIPMIGPYDKFAVEWGYKPFPEATTYEAEKKKLDEIVARQVKDPTLRFGDPSGSDPSAQTEDLGSDAVAATELGLKNLDRVASYLVKATAKKGEDYELLRNMYQQLLGQRNRELNHVVALIGGSVETNLYFGDAERRFDPVPAEKQREAVAFLLRNGFQVPSPLIDPAITDRLEADGAVSRISNAQASLLRSLVGDARIRRMAEQTSRNPTTAYSPRVFLGDLREGIWAELKGDQVAIDLYRRNLQRTYLEQMIGEVGRDSTTSDLPALARAELRALLTQIAGLESSRVSEPTRIFLDDVKARITQALEPKAIVQSAPAATPFRLIFGSDVEAPADPE